MARGDGDLAVQCFYRAVDRDPENLDALQCLATALAATGRHQETLPIYKMIVNLAPDDPKGDFRQAGATARFNLAVALSRLEQFDQAAQAYRELLADHDDFGQAWYNLASLSHSQGRLTEARDAWKQVVRLNPRLVTAQVQLGEVLMDLGEPAEAMKAYAEAAKLQSADPAAWLNLANAAQAAGSLGRAATALKRAAELTPNDATVWARLGDVLLGIHRATSERPFLNEAVAAWRESLRLNGDQKRIRELIATYEKVLTTQPSTGKSP